MGKLTVRSVQSFIKEASEQIQTKKSGKLRLADGNGLYIVVPKKGEPYWMMRYTIAGKRSEMTIGKQSLLSLADARNKAIEYKKSVNEGVDPIMSRHNTENSEFSTLDGLFIDWQKGNEKRLKYPNIPRRIYTKDISPLIGRYKLKAIKPLDIKRVIESITDSGRPSIANDALQYLKQLFNHAMKLGLSDSNPAQPFNVNDAGGMEKSRERALTFKELEFFFRVMREQPEQISRENYLACSLLVCLGVRKQELIQAKWHEFDLANAIWKLPKERSKTGQGFTIPLALPIVEWLEELKVRSCGSEYVFPSRRRSKNPYMGADTLNRAISKLFGIEPGKSTNSPNIMGEVEHFTVHDLRRTCRSLLSQLKTPSHIAERCLNHKLKGVEGIYDQYDYFDERKEALDKLADSIAQLVNITPNNVEGV